MLCIQKPIRAGDFVTAQRKREIVTGSIVTLLIVCAALARVMTRGRRDEPYFLPVSLAALYSVLYISRIPWIELLAGDMTVVQCLLLAAGLESCIRCGLIQSNTGYRALFEASVTRAEITDESLHVQAASVPHELFPEDRLREAVHQTTQLDRNTLLKSSPIRKGFVFWQEDISELQEALDELRLVQEELRDAGDILKEENAQKARKLKLEEQTRLYDLIEQESAPQFARLDALLSELSATRSPEDAKRLLGRIAVIMTYIKRRSNLPAAICIFSARGLVRLMNRRMLAVGTMLLGSGIQTLGELQAALEHPPETVTKDASMPGVYHFPDGSALRFSQNEILDRDGQRYTEVIAADVSELMDVRAQLDAENRRLDAANRALRKLGEEMADIVREEEILNMKIRVHDDIGYSLLSVRRAYWQCEDMDELHTLAGQWRTTIRLLHADVPEAPADALEYARMRAKELGAEVELTGTFPKESAARELFSLAIRECTFNCVRHAGGTKILADCRLAQAAAILTVTNDGSIPQAPISEGGGLTGLRRRVEQMQGTMLIESRPRFTLTIKLPIYGDGRDPRRGCADGQIPRQQYAPEDKL